MQALSEVIVRAGVVATVGCAMSCEPYRIEYHSRPAFYKQATDQDLPDEVVLEDGTVVRFVEQDVNAMPASLPGFEEGVDLGDLEIRRQSEDGSIQLRAFAPEHVLAHAKQGIRLREYRLLWDQLLAERTREAYARSDQGFEEFAEFCESNRPAMMETFNRMGFGLFSPDVIQESLGKDGIRYRLHPRLGEQFVFTEFDVTREPTGMKWLMIR